MVNKLNLRMKEIYDRIRKAGAKVEEVASSLEKSKTPTFFKYRIRLFGFLKNLKVGIKYLLLIIPVIAIFLLTREVQYRQSLKTGAGLHQASVAFHLQNWTLPPENVFDVWINSDSPVAFANIYISFDPKVVKLTHEITTTGGLTRIIKVTSMANANSTGTASIVLGLDPSLASTPPNGAFQVASLTFDANTTNQNVATVISFDSAQMQLVATDQSTFQLTTANLNLVINPVATPSPTPTPISTGAPMVSPSPTPSPTKSPSCLKCFKKQCDGICAKSDSKTLCPDCL